MYRKSNHAKVISDCRGIKFKINNNTTSRKILNIQKLNSILLNNSWVKEEITKKCRKYFELYDKEYVTGICY